MPDKKQVHEEARIANALERIATAFESLAASFKQAFASAQSATLTITDSKGNKLMPATIQVGQTAQAVYQEWSGLNGTGSKLAPAGPPTFTSSDPTIASVDPVTGLITAMGPGTATITGTDSVNGLSASDSVSDTPLTAQSATLVITPIPPPASATAAKK